MKGKRKLILFGIGQLSDYVYEHIDLGNNIVIAAVDSDKTIQGTIWRDSIKIVSPEHIIELEFDKVVITVKKYEAIYQECLSLDIPESKLFCFWKNETDNICYNRAVELRKAEARLYNLPYELEIAPSPKLLASKELLNEILENHRSLSRYGDGEFEMMMGRRRPWFQTPSESLSKRLIEVLGTSDNRICIAIADDFGCLEKYTEKAADAIRYYNYKSKRDIYRLLDMNRVYYNAYVTRPYLIYRDRHHATNIFDLFKRIWNKRDVCIIEGVYARNGLGNDLFESAASIRRVLCPPKNAWDKYDTIYKSIVENVSKSSLILISLGPTATVLAYDLMKAGYQALDIGQLDNEYDWFLEGATEQVDIPGKQVAEFQNNVITKPINDENYYHQVIVDISR